MKLNRIAEKLAALASCVALVVGLVPVGAVQQAGASPETTFTVSSGTTEGTEVPCGTPVTFKVLTEPEGTSPGTVQVGDGSSLAISSSYAGAIAIPEYVSSSGASYEVVSCGASSFSQSKIVSVSLPDSVTTLEKRSFFGCSSLRKVALGEDSALSYIYTEAFYAPASNGSLEDFYFPAGLSWVGDEAFNGQVALHELHFNCDYLDYLGTRAFANCTGLVSAEIPGTSADGTGLDFRSFGNCTNLETVVFRGSVLKEAEGAALNDDKTLGTRTFEGCGKLSKVVYRGKKYLPSWGSFTGGGNRSFLGFSDSDPALYVTLSYYPSKQAAEAATDAIGTVCVRDDVLLSEVKPGMKSSDEKGTVVYDGSVPELPSGYDAWAYESGAKSDEPVSDSLYAYPVQSTVLDYATFSLDRQVFDFTGASVSPVFSLIDASGKTLEPGTDYQVSYERKQGDAWTATDDLTSVGELRARATPVPGSTHTGSVSADFSIALAQEGSSFTSEGVSYCITQTAETGKAGTVDVGDGESLAVASSYSGALAIPATVSPEGSSLEYTVTGIAAHAFGGDSESAAVTGLSSIELPSTLQSIGTYAFGYCTGLQKVAIPADVASIGARAFDHCSGLSSLSFEGESIASLGTYAFASCSALRSLVLPSIESAADHTFANCSMLSRVDFTGTFPSESLPTRFAGCKRLTRVVCLVQAYPDALESGVYVYYPVTFQDAGGTILGSALVQAGTALSALNAQLASPQLLEGAVPSLPSGYSTWAASDGSASSVNAPLSVKPSKAKASGAASAKAATINAKTVTAKLVAKVKDAKGVTLGPKVRSIKAGAFKKSKATTLVVKSAKLTVKSVKGSLTGSKVKRVVLKGAAKKKRTSYAKCFAKANCGKQVSLS